MYRKEDYHNWARYQRLYNHMREVNTDNYGHNKAEHGEALSVAHMRTHTHTNTGQVVMNKKVSMELSSVCFVAFTWSQYHAAK